MVSIQGLIKQITIPRKTEQFTVGCFTVSYTLKYMVRNLTKPDIKHFSTLTTRLVLCVNRQLSQ